MPVPGVWHQLPSFATFTYTKGELTSASTLYVLSAHARCSCEPMRAALLFCEFPTANGRWRPLAVIGDHFCVTNYMQRSNRRPNDAHLDALNGILTMTI